MPMTHGQYLVVTDDGEATLHYVPDEKIKALDKAHRSYCLYKLVHRKAFLNTRAKPRLETLDDLE